MTDILSFRCIIHVPVFNSQVGTYKSKTEDFAVTFYTTASAPNAICDLEIFCPSVHLSYFPATTSPLPPLSLSLPISHSTSFTMYLSISLSLSDIML